MTIATDRRAALKAKHRAAILQAARDLIDERGGRDFSVDDLAARADIARRTVFNHFASLDEVLLAVCEQELSVIIDRFLADMARTPVGDGSRASMFDELESAARGADLAPAIAGMYRILGDPGKDDPKAAVLTQTAFSRVTERLRHEVARRYPAADPLDAALLVEGLMSGIVVIAEHWLATSGPSLDQPALDEWDDLLARLVHSVRSGYMAND
ncbi:TetR/AcrR family transcriptional regulator [Curtobacterium aurantiacum]|uniref:TetR/AcrR family transcriptional regulator n=1 Tax=Curtobacterium aurantiacum TaxID=3236919 RepID=A0ABS5VCU8_9MICO|nr:TetR/AcrR family transcriptional regulator [Curtobacterium flaccumfaciens]MBT1544493.1 TetR/AcrR family transcriptional regulator [Curtobacterium flaccumfaciens pv. flaccumfaciens]MBT1587321.1 TetR/AcrR family transcriptional regulator [Curtobacterium flaccumfaciens pv. flaccumfaciens]